MSPFRVLPGSTERRFWEKVDKNAAGGCWVWTGAVSSFGHGTVRIGKKLLRAHRVAWEWARGPVPEGLNVLHRCDVPGCVNVEHLFLGTKAENTADMMSKSRGRYAEHRGEDAGTAKLTDEQVIEIRRRWAKDGCFGKGHGGRSRVKQRELAREFGLSQTLISSIVRRETWTHLP